MADNAPGSTPVTLVVTESQTVTPQPPPPASPPPHGSLPFTGFAVVAALLLAVLLVSVGSFLILVGRRSRSTTLPRSA